MNEPKRIAMRLAAGYGITALAWIFVSDWIVSALPKSMITQAQSMKGFVFVLVTSVIAYILTERMRLQLAEEAERSSAVERMLAQVVTTVPVGVVLTADDGTVTFMNSAAEKMLGASAHETLGMGIDEVCCQETGRGAEVFAQLTRTGEVEAVDVGGREGVARRSVLARAAEIDPTLPASGWVIALADITEAHKAWAAAEHLVGGYRFLSLALSESARATNARTLLKTIAELAIGSGRYSAAWAVAYLPGSGYVDVVTLGMGPGGLSVAQMMRDMVNEDPSAVPFSAGEILVSNDISRDPTNPWHPAAEEGLGSSATLTVAIEEHFVASLTLFAPNPGEFDAPEVEMLQSLQQVIARAILGLQGEDATRE